jgi:hypothetical protein
MRLGPLTYLRKAIKRKHHITRAYTQAVAYYRHRDQKCYRAVIRAYRAYVLRRRATTREGA